MFPDGPYKATVKFPTLRALNERLARFALEGLPTLAFMTCEPGRN